MILAGLSDQDMGKVKDALSQRFDIKDCGTTLLQASGRVRKKNVGGTNDCLIIT